MKRIRLRIHNKSLSLDWAQNFGQITCAALFSLTLFADEPEIPPSFIESQFELSPEMVAILKQTTRSSTYGEYFQRHLNEFLGANEKMLMSESSLIDPNIAEIEVPPPPVDHEVRGAYAEEQNRLKLEEAVMQLQLMDQPEISGIEISNRLHQWRYEREERLELQSRRRELIKRSAPPILRRMPRGMSEARKRIWLLGQVQEMVLESMQQSSTSAVKALDEFEKWKAQHPYLQQQERKLAAELGEEIETARLARLKEAVVLEIPANASGDEAEILQLRAEMKAKEREIDRAAIGLTATERQNAFHQERAFFEQRISKLQPILKRAWRRELEAQVTQLTQTLQP